MKTPERDESLEALEDRVAEILELPDEEQRAAFDRVRADYPEHDALLRRWERAALEIDAVPGLPDSKLPAPVPRPLPESIGNFRILDVLGKGGMGIVYLAEQEHPVRRRVALKVMLECHDSKHVLARFESERQALALMSHSNIAKVLDAGVAEDGRPFFALEHVPGRPITAYCDAHRVGLRERVELFQKVCSAVQHAHQKGIVHRDLKPSNVLVRACDGYAEPKVIDFGVAKALQQRLTERTLYTEQGRILGTPEYMSPEQADVATVDVDTRSDIYSLGVMLYELLVGRLPFDSEDLRRNGYFGMQRKILEDDPVRPSTRSSTLDAEEAHAIARRRRTEPAGLGRALRGDLDWIIMRCLEKDPARRYQAASELAADLQRYLDGDPVLAGPPSALYALRKLIGKHRLALGAAAIAIVALAIGLALALWQWSEARESAREARENLRSSRSNAKLASEAGRRAEEELVRSRALNLAYAAERALGTDPLEALVLALRAYELESSLEIAARVLVATTRQHLVARLGSAERVVRAAKVAPRSRRILTLEQGAIVRMWSMDGEELLILRREGVVRELRFSGDERLILTVEVFADGREVARAFDLTGEEVASVGAGPATASMRLSWHPTGGRLVAAEGDGRVTVLGADGAELEELVAPRAEDGRPSWPVVRYEEDAVIVDSDGETAIFWQSGERRVTRLPTGSLWRVWVAPGVAGIRLPDGAIDLDPRGELVTTIGRDRSVRLWSRGGSLVAAFGTGAFVPLEVSFSPSGARLLSTHTDGTVRIWTRAGHPVAVCDVGIADLGSARFWGADGRILATLGDRARLFNGDGRILLEIPLTSRPSTLLDVEPIEGRFVTAEFGGPASLWDISGFEPFRLVSSQDRIWGSVQLPAGGILATGRDGTVEELDERGRGVRVFSTGTAEPLYGLAVSPSEELVVAGGHGGSIFGWDRRSGALLWERELEPATPVTTLVFADDGRQIIAVQGPRSTAYWMDRETGEPRVILDRGQPGDEVHSPNWATASPDGRMIALDTRSGHVRLCDQDGRTLADFEVAQPGLGLHGTAFHPGGRWLTTVSAGTVRIWDLDEVLRDPASARPVHELGGASAAFSPDGEQLLVQSHGVTRLLRWGNLDEVDLVVTTDPTSPDGALPRGFSEDGRWLTATSQAGLRRWPADVEQTLDLVRAYVARFGEGVDLSRFQELIEGSESSGD